MAVISFFSSRKAINLDFILFEIFNTQVFITCICVCVCVCVCVYVCILIPPTKQAPRRYVTHEL